MLSGTTAFFLAILTISGTVVADTIQSVPDGGAWSDETTWESSRVPGVNDDVVITGVVSIGDSAGCRNLTVENNATLQNDTASARSLLMISGNVSNSGTIRNAPDSGELRVELSGDCINNGTWAPAGTFLALQHRQQKISQAASSRFEGEFYFSLPDYSADTVSLVAGSDLHFHAAVMFDCTKFIDGLTQRGAFDMAGFDLTLSGDTYLTGATFLHTKAVTCRDSSMIGNTVFEHPVQACGNFQIALQSVYFLDTLTVIDTLENGAGGCCIAQGIMSALGGIVNKGVIRDHPDRYELWCNIGGDIIQSGTWTNARNTLTDSAAQVLRIENGVPIRTPFVFDGMWPNAPYLWEKDDTPLPDETTRLMFLDSIGPSSTGVYHCRHDSVRSRTITVLWDSTAVATPQAPVPAHEPCCSIINHANPYIRLLTPDNGCCIVSLCDLRGSTIRTSKVRVTAGVHRIAIPYGECATGIYLVRVHLPRFEKTMRCTLFR